jgi:8-amino-3,8-dideoxy-alpha-D-manno-octulosonate transaminase
MAAAVPLEAAVAGQQVAAQGGRPVRTTPLTTEFPGTQFYDDQERTELMQAYESHSLFRFYGPQEPRKVAKFEQELAATMGTKYALAVTSGTAALHCALTALGVGPGDEVILPAWTWHSCYTTILLTGALPVFAEVDESFTIDPEDLERKITPQTKAIMVVHLFGAPANMGAILPIAKKHGLKVLEDAAQSAGARYQGKRVGSIGDIGIYSFQIHKLITAGEGGAVVTNDPLLYERAIRFHDLGSVRPVHAALLGKPQMPFFPGINYRMNEMTGAVMRGQLRKLDTIRGRLQSNSRFVKDKIKDLPGIHLRRENDSQGETGWTIDVLLPNKNTRDRFIAAMRAENVPMGAPSAATPLPPFPYIEQKAAPHPAWPTFNSPRGKAIRYGAGCCPRTVDIFNRAATLTMGPKYSESDLNDIVVAFTKVHGAVLA